MSRAVGDDVVAVGARDAVDDDGAETEVVEKRGRRGGVAEGIDLPRDGGAPRGSIRGEDVAEGTDALVRLRGGEMRGDVRLVVAHPTAADDVESAVREKATREREPRGRARFGRGVPPEVVRSIGGHATGRGVPPGVVRSIGGAAVGEVDVFVRGVRAIGRGGVVAALLEPTDEERRVREGETPPRVARQRGEHRGVDDDAETLVVPVEGDAPARVEVRVRHEMHARPLGRARLVRLRAPHVRRAVAGREERRERRER